MRQLVDIQGKDIYIGAEVIVTDTSGYLYKTVIIKFTDKSVIFKNTHHTAKDKAYHRIYIL